MWFVYALLSAVFAAAVSILAKAGIENVNSNLATAIRTAGVVIMALAYSFRFGSSARYSQDLSKKLGLPDSKRYSDRSFVALLFQGDSDRLGFKGSSCR